MDESKCCRNCAFAKATLAQDKSMQIECHRFPPTVTVIYMPSSGGDVNIPGGPRMVQLSATNFPQPKADWLCGEWRKEWIVLEFSAPR